MGKIMKDKFEIAQQFLDGRSFEHQAGRNILAHPDLAKDQGFKKTLLDSSLTTYRALMFALGTPPNSIHSNVQGIREARSTRNGVVEFANNVYSSWDQMAELYAPVPLSEGEAQYLSSGSGDLVSSAAG